MLEEATGFRHGLDMECEEKVATSGLYRWEIGAIHWNDKQALREAKDEFIWGRQVSGEAWIGSELEIRGLGIIGIWHTCGIKTTKVGMERNHESAKTVKWKGKEL